MKLYKYSLACMLGLGLLTSCADRLELVNPNQQTSGTFGYTADDLEESVIAAYNHIRMEGSYARVGYTIDITRSDEVWNSSQVWYLSFDDLNVPLRMKLRSGLGENGTIPSMYATSFCRVAMKMTASWRRI